MKRLIFKLIQNILSCMHSKKRYYSFFYFLYLQGLKGMDHGDSYIYPEDSGEYGILAKVATFYQKRNVVFFDVGANTGYYAKKVLKTFSNVSIYCFEPSGYTYQKLLNNLGNSVKTFQIALSNQSGTSVLHLDKNGSGMASLEDTTYSPPFGIASSMIETVTTDTIDRFCETHFISRIHFLKMDIEGHEYAALEGAMKMIKENSIDFIQFEFGRFNIDSGASLKKFYALLHKDYSIYRIIRTGSIPQFDYNYEYEIYLGTNFIAVNKQLNFSLV